MRCTANTGILAEMFDMDLVKAHRKRESPDAYVCDFQFTIFCDFKFTFFFHLRCQYI